MYFVTLFPFRLNPLNDSENILREGKLLKVRDTALKKLLEITNELSAEMLIVRRKTELFG